MRLDRKTIIITGAASGIGQASARRALEEGARVIGVDLNGDGMPDGVEPVIGDVTAAATIARAVETAGTIHGLGTMPASAAPESPSMSSRPKTGTRFLL